MNEDHRLQKPQLGTSHKIVRYSNDMLHIITNWIFALSSKELKRQICFLIPIRYSFNQAWSSMHYYSGLDFLGAAPYCPFNLLSRPVLVCACTYAFSLSILQSICFRNYTIPPLILYHISIYHLTILYHLTCIYFVAKIIFSICEEIWAYTGLSVHQPKGHHINLRTFLLSHTESDPSLIRHNVHMRPYHYIWGNAVEYKCW